MSTDLHTLAGAYAVDALTTAEAEQFETHLDGCDACRDEVRELQDAAALMGAAEAMAPPPALKARVLAAADRMPQLPPRVTPVERIRPTRWWPRALGAAAAVVVIVVGSLIGLEMVRDPYEPPSGSVAAVFDEADREATLPTSDGGTLRVAVSEESGQIAFQTDALRTLGSEQVYQFWSIDGGRIDSEGLVEDLEEGKVLPMPAAGSTVAITVEPEGGSRQPTTEPIAQVDPADV